MSEFLRTISRVKRLSCSPLKGLAEQPPIPFLPKYHSYRSLIRVREDLYLSGLGSDKNIVRAVEKAICEGIERFSIAMSGESQLTSGVAAHPDRNVALEHAMLELIERDAFLVHWLSGISPIRLDPKSVKNESLRRVFSKIAKDGNDCYLLGFTLDIPVAVCGVLIFNRQNKRSCLGLSAHWQIEQAIEHALVESLLLYGKSLQWTVVDHATRENLLAECSPEGNLAYHWGRLNNDHLQFLINVKTQTSIQSYVESRCGLYEFSTLENFLCERNIAWQCSELDCGAFADIVAVRRCIMPSLQALFFGYPSVQVVNRARLNNCGCEWRNRAPHVLN